MKKREIKGQVRGKNAVDGAGVRLVRVLGRETIQDFDPFLMLDSFDSQNPSDYLAGFPMHPHRGIETVTYLISGQIDHKDSLGNKDTIHSGECQWMTAGSGIMHEEMPKQAPHMLGLQLWLNLPKSEKMAVPAYCSLTNEDIPTVESGSAQIRVLSGSFGETAGLTPKHIQASIYDVALPMGQDVTLPTTAGETVFVFLIDGDAIINDTTISSKTAVLFTDGDFITISAPQNADLRFVFFSGKPLSEPVAWGGPIVMNTQEELELAFKELRSGDFIKYKQLSI